MQSDDVYKATAVIIQSLARGDTSFPPQDLKIALPGDDSPEKKALEKELRDLVGRVRKLEARAAITNGQTFPETPNEFSPSSPFAFNTGNNNRHPSPVPGLISPATDGPDQSNQSQLEFLQQKCKSHEKEIQENRKKLKDLIDETERVKRVPQVPIHEAEKIDRLQRELNKSQQANEAFSKALREIGEIVTAGMSLMAWGAVFVYSELC